MKPVYLVIMSALCLFMNGCASLYCSPGMAQILGELDASNWDISKRNLSNASLCKGSFSADDFERHYEIGFRYGLASKCTYAAASQKGVEAAMQGVYYGSYLSLLSRCEDLGVSADAVRSAYTSGYKSQYCSASRIRELAQAAGAAIRQPDLYDLDICGGIDRTALTRIYNETYKAALKEACSPVSASLKGEADSRAGNSSGVALEKYRGCSESLQNDLVQTYRQAYTETQQQILVDRQNKILDEAEKAARDRRIRASESSFIYNDAKYLTTCEILFSENRVKIVASPQGKVRGTPKKWRVGFFDDRRHLLNSRDVKREVYFKGKDSKEFTLDVDTISDGAKVCKVALRN